MKALLGWFLIAALVGLCLYGYLLVRAYGIGNDD
jgi:hypothetical protein